MYKALIDNGATYLFDNNTVSDFNKKNIMGFLINHNSIKELVSEIPIDKFYVRDTSGNISEITKKQAYYLYEKLIAYSSNKDEKGQKVKRNM